MGKNAAWFFVLALGCCIANAADNPSPKQVVKEKVEEINNALIKEDFAKVIELTHPKAIELVGGKEKAISALESVIKEMKTRGLAFRATKIDDPSDPLAVGTELFVVAPFVLESKAPFGKVVQKSFYIGVSSDRGKTWVFVNGDYSVDTIKKVLPNLPEKLKLPEHEKPVIVKESEK